jgi:hypothetical protein
MCDGVVSSEAAPIHAVIALLRILPIAGYPGRADVGEQLAVRIVEPDAVDRGAQMGCTVHLQLVCSV